MTKYSKKAEDKVAETMREMKKGTLRSSKNGKKVTNPKQAIAMVYQKPEKRMQKFLQKVQINL